MPRYGIAPQLSSHWFPQGTPHESPDVCKRGCCWSPYGHSSAARNCTCHGTPTGTRGINRSAAVNHPVEGLGRDNNTTPVAGTEREGKNDDNNE